MPRSTIKLILLLGISHAILSQNTPTQTNRSQTKHSQSPIAQPPIGKGEWKYDEDTPQSVVFVYGTTLNQDDLNILSQCKTLKNLTMGFAGIDSEYVSVDGELSSLGRLKHLKEVHLCIKGMQDKDLRFIAELTKIKTLEFNADNGHSDSPICTDRCVEFLSAAKTLRSLTIHDGKFTDQFVDQLTKGLPRLEHLTLNSADFTDESLRMIASRCKQLRTLSIASDHFTSEGVDHLKRLAHLSKPRIHSPELKR